MRALVIEKTEYINDISLSRKGCDRLRFGTIAGSKGRQRIILGYMQMTLTIIEYDIFTI